MDGALRWAAAGACAALAAERVLAGCLRRVRSRRAAATRPVRHMQHSSLRAAIRRILKAAGSDDNEQRTVADHLVDANLAGHDSHGVQMIQKYMQAYSMRLVVPNTHAKVVSHEGSTVTVDGQGGFGPVVAREAMRLALPVAKEKGVCVIAVRNCFHIGRVGPYMNMAADAGMVAFCFVNAVGHPPLVAPYGGRDARVSTNPFCASVPLGDGRAPMCLDFATSIVANGKLQAAANRGAQVDLGIVLDEHGNPTTDPRYPSGFGARTREDIPDAGGMQPGEELAFEGAIQPFGMHKGSGLALLCEILGGCLTGGDTIHPRSSRRDCPTAINSFLAVVVDPAHLCGGSLQDNARGVLDYFKSSRPLPFDHLCRSAVARPPPLPCEETGILAPGERELIVREQRLREGIPVAEGTWDEVLRGAEIVGIAEVEMEAMVLE
eukprot:TRINITY_DN46912_c0_g1_i1.p1 TRINITY_DN46912_c0_g1~~TRINITY_DN46912_c0_g1_i1.p1  ORF type:complete len:436 (+),score=116.00 TRINITY_DN46912_c0_g1_i1:49-1356(+)